MKCKIKIKTVNADGKSLFEGEGEYTDSGGERVVEYLFGDDPCKIIFRGGSLIQIHGGDMNLKITFTEGKTTACVFSEGGLSGGYEVFTRRLAFFQRAGASFARVLYSIADERSQNTDITVCVIPVK